MVDQIVLRGDQRAGEAKQIEIRKTEGNRGRVIKQFHSLFSFRALRCVHAVACQNLWIPAFCPVQARIAR